jgi:RNA-directed DNA polymerase
MGAPTSPVLSNLVCLNLDHELENYAKYSGITFTRYADDFTFSSKKTLSYKDIQYLLSIIHHYGFIENTDKVKLLQSDDIKIVTGIRVLNERLELPEHYIEQINIEIQRLKTVLAIENRYHTGISFKKLNLLKQEITGKINFVAQILGNKDEHAQQLEDNYLDAIQPKDNYESINWLEIPYTFK